MNSFLSKDNQRTIYNNIISKNNLQSLPRNTKEVIVNNLTQNMKKVYKKIDIKKVNKNNLSNILEQFNSLSLNETEKNLKAMNIISSDEMQISRVKFNRDFNSTPNKQVKFLERPMHNNNNLNNNNTYQSQNIKNDIMKSTSSLDNMFQPIMNNISNTDLGYANSRSTNGDINNQMENINKIRENETGFTNKRPTTPDFLKSQKTQNKNEIKNDNVNNIQPINSSQQSNNNDLSSFSGGSDNYFSFDDINKPLVQNEVVEDSLSFEERLKQLHRDREDPMIPQQQMQQQQMPQQQMPQQQMPQQQMQQQQMQQQQMQQQQMQQQKDQQDQQMRQLEEMQKQIERQEYENKLIQKQRELELRKKELEEIQNVNQNQNQNNSQLNSLLERLNKLENAKEKDLIIENLNRENANLKNEIKNLEDIQERISKEFEELNKKNNLVQSNMQIMNQRELELNNKENEINLLLNNYRQILNSRFYQMNVTSKDNKSQYSYFFGKIDNISSIKIISYSIPQARYNIDNNSNLLKYKINDEELEFTFKKGKYTIENLIENLNKIDNLDFKLNIDQKIEISSECKFELEFNNLTNILGITSEDEIVEEDNKYILNASKTWDLRIDNKLFLYFTNINEEPISIIYFNGNCESQIHFQEPIELSQLDVELRDSYGNLYDFDNLGHSINLQLELINQFNEIVPDQSEFMLSE